MIADPLLAEVLGSSSTTVSLDAMVETLQSEVGREQEVDEDLVELADLNLIGGPRNSEQNSTRETEGGMRDLFAGFNLRDADQNDEMLLA